MTVVLMYMEVAQDGGASRKVLEGTRRYRKVLEGAGRRQLASASESPASAGPAHYLMCQHQGQASCFLLSFLL